MGALSTFLQRNTITESGALPLVHTTRSYNIGRIKRENELTPALCRHFHEDLTYLFVGRPAYKRTSSGSAADYWELPCCFIFDVVDESLVRRIFPFDSGAFRSGLYPDYIGFMNGSEFEVKAPSAPRRIISAFFGSADAYFYGRAKSSGDFEKEFDPGVLDAEVKALRRLAGDGTPSGFDDRRFSIEVQLGGSINLTTHPPCAVVLPSIYLRDADIRRRIVEEWGAEPLTYEMYGLSQDKYDAIIYAKVEEYYKGRGLF